MWEGTWPTVDERGRDIKTHYPGTKAAAMAGKPLAGKAGSNFIFTLYKLTADLEHWAEDWDLPRHNAVHPCALCPVSSREGDLPWTDFRENAPWITRTYTNAVFRDLFPGAHIIFSCQPGVGVETLAPDYLHDKHLGFDAYFLSSVLVMLVYYIMPKDTAEDNLIDLWLFIKAWYKTSDGLSHAANAYQNMRLPMFCSGPDSEGGPLLKGRAAEIAALTPALLAGFREFMDQNDPHQKQVRLGLKLSANLDKIISIHKDDDVLPASAAAQFQKTTFNLMAIMTSINKYGYTCNPPRRLFNITIKIHYLLHIALLAKDLNPRHGWCYRGEDMMQKAKLLAASCCKSRTIYNVFEKMDQKYLFGLHHLYTADNVLGR